MRLTDVPAMRTLVADAQVAHLGTIAADGRAHLVPVVFALCDETLVSPVDHKPKTTKDLARLANIRRDPRVTVLVDRYDDDWTALWWVRVDGDARVVDDGGLFTEAVDALTAKYEPYREQGLEGPIIVIRAERWTGWRASG